MKKETIPVNQRRPGALLIEEFCGGFIACLQQSTSNVACFTRTACFTLVRLIPYPPLKAAPVSYVFVFVVC